MVGHGKTGGVGYRTECGQGDIPGWATVPRGCPGFQVVQFWRSAVVGGVDRQTQCWGRDCGKGFGCLSEVDRLAQPERLSQFLAKGAYFSESILDSWQTSLPPIVLVSVDPAVAVAKTGEHGLHGVIVLLWDRIELVTVTSCAANREAEEHRSGGRDHLVQFVLSLLPGQSFVGTLDRVTGAGNQEPRGGVVSGCVSGELIEDKTVVGSVVVESLDDVIAVIPGVADP